MRFGSQIDGLRLQRPVRYEGLLQGYKIAKMRHNASHAILPFAASVPLTLPIEVQRFEYGHFVESAGLHGHRFNEIMLFESAGGVHRVGDLETLPTVGTVDAIGESQIHKVELSKGGGGWLLLFPDIAVERAKLPLDVLNWFSRRGSDQSGRCALSVTRRRRLALYLSTLEGNQQRVSTADGGEKPALALFSAILRELRTGHDLQAPTFAAYRHLELLLETIDERYKQRLTLADLADAVGLSKAFLTTDIREKTGRTAMQWVLERRMSEARRLLAETDLPVTQIAHDLGFEDSSHFARRFRDLHERSPLAWRAAKESSR